MAQENVVGWFEIPVNDMDRAIRFYESIFVKRLEKQVFGKTSMAWFPMEESSYGTGGGLVYNPEVYTPGNEGPLIYFTSPTGDITLDLDRIEQAGGKIMMEKTLISEDLGYMAVFYDTEGNRIALHSRV
jgi:uncharacterized protein